jgi:predicted DNA-binding transcriptional regulator AlpA
MYDPTIEPLLREQQVRKLRGNISRSQLYRDIKEKKTFPEPVHMGGSIVWPRAEVQAMNMVLISGASEDEQRAAVRRLLAQRKAAAAGVLNDAA